VSLTRIIQLIFGGVILGATYYLINQKNPVKQIEPDTQLPVFSGSKLTNTSYNEQGIRSFVITSELLEHFAESGETHFQQPVLKLYRDGYTLEWQIFAKRAVLSKDNQLMLSQEVRAQNLLPDSGFDTMATDALSIQLDSRDFWSEETVTLKGLQFQTIGQAMKGSFSTNQATLYPKIQGKYETHNP